MSADFAYDESGHAEILAARRLPAVPGSEQAVAAWIRDSLAPFELPADRLEALQSAMAEAVLSAAQAGGDARETRSLLVRVSLSPAAGQLPQPAHVAAARGWGFFLVQRPLSSGSAAGTTHLIELVLYQAGGLP